MTPNKIDTIYSQCKEICSYVSKILLNLNKLNSLLYDNQRNGYYILGIDILVRDNLEPVLIELNDKTGYSFKHSNTLHKMSKEIYNWINDTVLEPLFKYNDPMKAREHPSYIKI
jgi:hypothetical protein